MSAPGARASTQTDAVDVRRLMEEYHSAVVGHDGARLAGLFVPTGSAWFNVLSGPGYAVARAKTPDAPKVRPGTVDGFVRFVSSSKAKLDPQHGPVTIRADGAIASVYFDFRFLIDGKVQNQGSESWQLVKFADGWRIASIVYSSTPPAA
ncbi:nuclear transport factor 2 family protein [Sphingomonas sp. ZT3P38]|uniref:nuclear transport factor 2 family protein n=1 Tax=Parasphingomonas zepuensis TaxID=3096161 RepID=UPI002FC6E002